MNGKLGRSHVLQEFKHENLTVREQEVGCNHVVREFEFVVLIGSPRAAYTSTPLPLPSRCLASKPRRRL
jgi:hypothetical protein